MDNTVYINDVGPRDGLQNQATVLTPAQRLQLIEALVDAGVTAIEAGSFVSEKAVPAMAGTGEIFRQLPAPDKVRYSALVPTMKYYELARDAGAKVLEVFVCATETMNQKNIRASIDDSMAAAGEVIKRANEEGIEVIACIAVAWECPFEGKTDPAQVKKMARQFLDMGASRLLIADTIGAANPLAVAELMSDLVAEHGADKLACHFHDTRAMGVANAFSALQTGIRHFDSSVGGLGGCPFAPGATGNVATEDLVMMLHQMGFETGIDLVKLMAAGQLAGELTGTCTGGRADRWRRLQLEKGRSLA
ncbi:3-hydroxy-3-isohexenylglutaryl-CoA/hydroxy-methylglutaryl-CoA lyase [Halioglobus japonicus]|nr:3-hydroxy-3-isohexenylglutaryl-CoA/hydroxy-methylglutaryl-CoA lyase [Halioglobus japonicus]